MDLTDSGPSRQDLRELEMQFAGAVDSGSQEWALEQIIRQAWTRGRAQLLTEITGVQPGQTAPKHTGTPDSPISILASVLPMLAQDLRERATGMEFWAGERHRAFADEIDRFMAFWQSSKTEPTQAMWYEMHDHGDGLGGHGHSTSYPHTAGSHDGPQRPVHHNGIRTMTWTEFQAARETAPVRTIDPCPPSHSEDDPTTPSSNTGTPATGSGSSPKNAPAGSDG